MNKKWSLLRHENERKYNCVNCGYVTVKVKGTIVQALRLCTGCTAHRGSRGSGVTRNLFGGGGSTNSVEDNLQRERGSGGGSPLVRGSGGSCNLVQEISFHIVKWS